MTSDFDLRASFVIRASAFVIPPIRPSSLLISSPFKTLREKLAPKNLVFREKNALCKKPISENLENRRKTTMGVLEKGKITSENTTVSQEFVKSEEWRVESGAWIVKREQGTADRGSEIGEEKRMNDEC